MVRNIQNGCYLKLFFARLISIQTLYELAMMICSVVICMHYNDQGQQTCLRFEKTTN